MNRTIWFIAAAVIIAGIAWFSSNRQSESETDTAPGTNASFPFNAPPPASNNINPGNSGGNQLQQPKLANSGMVNPAHGQPGHRCDIPVGAPLSTPASSVAQQPPGTQPAAITVPAPTNNQPVASAAAAAGMNPAHGQPGHRCDIPVGAPLNSKPAAPKPAVTSSNATPAINVAKGKNPPHGQPNHLCDLPVGADFDSANAAKKLKPDTTVQ